MVPMLIEEANWGVILVLKLKSVTKLELTDPDVLNPNISKGAIDGANSGRILSIPGIGFWSWIVTKISSLTTTSNCCRLPNEELIPSHIRVKNL